MQYSIQQSVQFFIFRNYFFVIGLVDFMYRELVSLLSTGPLASFLNYSINCFLLSYCMMLINQCHSFIQSGGHNVARRTLFLTLLASNFYQFYALFSVQTSSCFYRSCSVSFLRSVKSVESQTYDMLFQGDRSNSLRPTSNQLQVPQRAVDVLPSSPRNRCSNQLLQTYVAGPRVWNSLPVDVQSALAPPPLDNSRVMVIVWRLRGNIIRTALCWIV